jgi:hypothetical protein
MDSRLRPAGMTNEDQALKLVILGLDPGIQSFFNINTKDKK